jgi:transposase
MYLRHATRRKNGRKYTYWTLVRSVRTGAKVRQETVAYLGELDAEGRASAKALARQITGDEDRNAQRDLFDGEDAEPISVRLDRVRLERSRTFGNVWLGCRLWRALQLDELFTELLPSGREGVSWAELIEILVIGRLCEPSSELHVAEQWYRTTALEDLFGIDEDRIHHVRLYRTLDRLLPHKEQIEKHLVGRLGELFQLDYDLLLYDVTSTYFEGKGSAEICKRGHSRDQRPDCVQVNIAMVVTRDGMPLGYEVFAGNTTDVNTVEEIVGTMEERYGRANRVWVMDRGMVSAKRIAWLQSTGRRYVIGTPRSELKKWERELTAREGWTQIREDIEVKICAGPDGVETFLLCRSASRAEKEKAMHARFSERIEQGLRSLQRRIAGAKKPIDRGKTERQIGRLLQRNSRAAARYSITVTDDPAHPAGIRLAWGTDARWQQHAELSEGTYILRTNVGNWTHEELWKTYIQLTDAEAAFRIHKSDLAIRPVWHQKVDRIHAHIFVCFLAYVLWKTLQKWQSRAGLGDSPRTLFTEFSRIHSADIVLPLADDTGREIRLRCVVRPEPAQAILIDRLGLTLPERIAPPQMLASSSKRQM